LLGVKTTVIYPATEKHIRKYEAQKIHLIEETPELYECVTLPHLEKERFSLKVNIEI
jgi:m7GpppX diphosphatase